MSPTALWESFPDSSYANTAQLEAEGSETVVARSTQNLLTALAADAPRIAAEDHRLAGTP